MIDSNENPRLTETDPGPLGQGGICLAYLRLSKKKYDQGKPALVTSMQQNGWQWICLQTDVIPKKREKEIGSDVGCSSFDNRDISLFKPHAASPCNTQRELLLSLACIWIMRQCAFLSFFVCGSWEEPSSYFGCIKTQAVPFYQVSLLCWGLGPAHHSCHPIKRHPWPPLGLQPLAYTFSSGLMDIVNRAGDYGRWCAMLASSEEYIPLGTATWTAVWRHVPGIDKCQAEPPCRPVSK